MPKVTYNPEKAQKQKKIIGAISVILLIVVMIISVIYAISILIWIPIALVIFGVSKLLMRKIGKAPL
ncbi:MAG: hypothetical protein LBI09_03490 [Nitrososphaerota archaeon]|nr:hypothetical protein [Nitrososphaerota archaeon]